MRMILLCLLLSACIQPPPAPEIVRVPIIIMKSQEDKEPIKGKISAPLATGEIPAERLLPPCPPETGDKQKDLLRLLNCTIETADKKLPPPKPVKQKKTIKKSKK
ncbi:MAG: hypothetical protein ABI216_22140 [Devosia sp.]